MRLPVERLDEDFFRLKTGVAGALIQKFLIYHFRVAIIGDISRIMDESSVLRDFVRESNRGDQICFVQSFEELAEPLAQAARKPNP